MNDERRPRGLPTGGQFAPRGRAEAEVTLIDPLTEFDRRRAERALDRARNGFGYALPPEARQRIIRFLERPSHRNWQSARTIMIAGPMSSLWEATITHGDALEARHEAATPDRNAALIGLEIATRKLPPTYPA